MDAAYYRAWRAANPDYRRRATERMAARRQARGREDRAAEYAARNAARRVTLEPLATLHHGHPLFDLARRLVRDVAPMAVWKARTEVDREDARSEAVLAALEGRDPAAAALGFLRSEAGWRRVTTTLVEAA